jgi:RsiW-degrading membrane proteinase PrsW (M82 family)
VKPFHWYSAVQFGLSALAVIIIEGLALLLVLAGLGNILRGAEARAAIPLFMLAASLGVAGLLALPSAGYALARLLGYPAWRWSAILTRPRWALVILALPLIILGGYWISRQEAPLLLVLPLLQPLAVSIPLVWICAVSLRGLPLGSPQRAWGVIASGAVLGPLLIFFLEVIAFILAVGIWSFAAASQPQMAQDILSLSQRLNAAPLDAQAMQEILLPYLSQPTVIFSITVFVAVVIPLLEELVKPIGLWLLAGRSMSPALGFTAGALSGAGFALVESLGFTSSAEDWAVLVFLRIGTGFVHIAASALVGWGLGAAWSEGRYLHLGLAYLSAVALHGLWNGLSILSAVGSFLSHSSSPIPGIPWLEANHLAFAGMALLSSVGFGVLLWGNHRLRSAAPDRAVITQPETL